MTVQIDEENEDGQGHLVELRESTSTALKIIVERQTFYGMDQELPDAELFKIINTQSTNSSQGVLRTTALSALIKNETN